MSISKLPDGRWAVRVQVQDPKTRRRLNRKGTAPTRREALELERSLRADARNGVRARKVTLEAYVKSWAEARRGALKPSVRLRYRQALEPHILPVLGKRIVESLTPADIQAYVNGRVEANAAGNTVLNELRLLRTISRDSVADGVAERHWADRVKPPPVSKYTEDRPNLLTEAELHQVLEAVPRQWSALVTLMATTGLRWGEASALSWEDVERSPEPVGARAARRPWDVVGEVHVRRSNWRGSTVTTKTLMSTRKTPLVRAVADMLGAPQTGWLFPTATGQLHRGTPLRKVLDRVVVGLGWATWDKVGKKDSRFWRAVGKRITPHGLRRTWNNIARQRGDRQIVQAITGHVTDAMTDHYSLVHRDEKAVLSSAVARGVFELEAPKGDKP